MNCNQCNFVYHEKIKYCPKCGNRINESTKVGTVINTMNSGISTDSILHHSTSSTHINIFQFIFGLIIGLVTTGFVVWLILT